MQTYYSTQQMTPELENSMNFQQKEYGQFLFVSVIKELGKINQKMKR